MACATAAIWLLDCSVEKKSEREREAAAAYYVCVSMQGLRERERERGESRKQVRMLLPPEREKGERERWREFRSFRFIWLADVTNRINQDKFA